MSEVKRYYVGHNPKTLGGIGLVEITRQYAEETGTKGLIKGEDYDTLRQQLTDVSNERDELNAALVASEAAVHTLSGGLRLMTSFGHKTTISAVRLIAKQTLNRAFAQSAPATDEQESGSC